MASMYRSYVAYVSLICCLCVAHGFLDTTALPNVALPMEKPGFDFVYPAACTASDGTFSHFWRLAVQPFRLFLRRA